MPINSKTGESYVVKPATGGTWHIYPSGRRVFVKARGTAEPAPVPAPPPPTESAASQASGFQPDAQFFAEDARAQFDVGQRKTTLKADQTFDKAQTDETIRRLEGSERERYGDIAKSTNAAGLFFSGEHAKQKNDTLTTFARQRSDTLQGYGERTRQREQEGSALEQGYTLDNAIRYAGAGTRRIEAGQGLADNNALTVNPTVPAAAPAAPRPAAVRPVVARPKPKKPKKPTRPRTIMGRVVPNSQRSHL
jgi:hypothetical protein